MTECTNVHMQDLLPEFIAEQLTAGDRAAVELHLASCDACRADHEVLVSVRHARPVPPLIDIASIVAALPRPGIVAATEDATVESGTRRPFLVVTGEHGAVAATPRASSRATSQATSRKPARQAGHRVFGAQLMRYAAAITLVAVGGLSVVMARRTPPSLTDLAIESPVIIDTPMEMASAPLPYSPERIPVRAVVSVAPSVLPIQELSDYSDEELALLMEQLEAWDGAPPVDSVSVVPSSGIDSAIQGSS